MGGWIGYWVFLLRRVNFRYFVKMGRAFFSGYGEDDLFGILVFFKSLSLPMEIISQILQLK